MDIDANNTQVAVDRAGTVAGAGGMARPLRKLPGHKHFRDFAAEIGAAAPL